MTQTIKIDLSKKETKSTHYNAAPLSDIQARMENNFLIITGVPKGDVIKYVARNSYSELYVVHESKHKSNRYSYRLHVGLENNLVEAKVTEVCNISHVTKRCRNGAFLTGGTMHVDYLLKGISGEFQFPESSRSNEKAVDYYNERILELEKLL